MLCKFYNWIVYPVLMTLNIFAFFVLFMAYKKGEFYLRDISATSMLTYFTFALTMRRFGKGSFRAKPSEDKISTDFYKQTAKQAVAKTPDKYKMTMLVLRWLISIIFALLTYIFVMVFGLVIVARLHAGLTVVFTLCGLSSIGVATICMPERLRLIAAKTFCAVFLILVFINTLSCINSNKWKTIDIAFLQGTLFGSFAPLIYYTRRSRLQDGQSPPGAR
jgi:hypothetical protein